MRPHPRIRKTVKWGGGVVSVVLLYAWPLCGAFHVGGVRLAPRQADLLLYALLVPLAVATMGAWIFDEIIVPAGTPADPAKLRDRMRRAARVMAPLPLVMLAALGTWYARFAWNEAHDPAAPSGVAWMMQMWWSCIAAAILWSAAAAFVYAFRPRLHAPGLCPKCSYNRAGLAPAAVCPECGSPT